MLRFRRLFQIFLITIMINLINYGCNMGQTDKSNNQQIKTAGSEKYLQKAIFAGGCFWCMEPPYDNLSGVISTTAGYIGGSVPDPTYEEVSEGKTGHAEAVEIVFDSTKISYGELLQVFWRNIDPTNPYGQFADWGSQYRTARLLPRSCRPQNFIRLKSIIRNSTKRIHCVITAIKPAPADPVFWKKCGAVRRNN